MTQLKGKVGGAIVEGCPAFGDGCPFSKMDADMIPAVMATLPKSIIEKCPAFKDGCPFKEDESVEDLYNHLSEMPASHRPGGSSPSAATVELVLRLVHEKSKTMKAQFNAQCPVFATSCPFKTVTTHGEPLVQELDDVVSRWGLADDLTLGVTPELQPEPEPLSKSLKAGTKSVHRAAENVRFVRDFLKGSVPVKSYIELLRSLHHIYSTLETALENLPKNLQHCDFRVLRRTEALEADIRRFTDTPEGQPMDLGKPSPAASQYVERLKKIASEQPLLLLAHAYTRYLGDLSGGQILARAASKAYLLPVGEGTAFYSFERIGSSAADIKAFKRCYRSSLDALELSSVAADAVVMEANTAFLMNMLIFEERDVAAGHLLQTRTLDEVMSLVEDHTSPLAFQKAYAKGKGSDKCPFLPPPELRSAGTAVCPWPFIFLHDPKAAIISHPVKNLGGILGLYGIASIFKRFPRLTGIGLLIAGGAVWKLKPQKDVRGPKSGH